MDPCCQVLEKSSFRRYAGLDHGLNLFWREFYHADGRQALQQNRPVRILLENSAEDGLGFFHPPEVGQGNRMPEWDFINFWGQSSGG
jgi:hypothetical protein